MKTCKINGQEYKNLRTACKAEGLSYDNALHFHKSYGSKFVMRIVKSYTVEVEENHSGGELKPRRREENSKGSR